MRILKNATPKELEQAEAALHTEVFSLIAKAQGGEVITKNGLTYTFSAHGPQPGGMTLFPQMTQDTAGPLLDEMMDYYRMHNAHGIGCYALEPPQPADLGIRVMARGFQPGWLPCWMATPLDAMQETINLPPGVELRADNTTDTENLEQLPYSGNRGITSQLFLQTYAPRAQRFLAFKDGQVIGQSSVVLCNTEPAVAGIFNVGVVPSMRNQGIGTAVVVAACRYAKEQGYGYALLNATGQVMYRRIGFQYISNGHTWWLQSKRYITHPPTASQVRLAEAVGRGDLKVLDDMAGLFTADELNESMANEMRLTEFAVHCRQPKAAQWLVDHGAICAPLDAWRLGWKDLFVKLLSNPQQVNRTYGHLQQTLLHIAAEKNDMELAQLTLQANPDLTIKDKTYNSTALGWAMFFKRERLIELLKKHSQ
jgi:GNAT superfamily N-acetyltransferase